MLVLVMLFAGHLLVFDNGTGKPYPFSNELACKQQALAYAEADKTEDAYQLICVPADKLEELVKANAPRLPVGTLKDA